MDERICKDHIRRARQQMKAKGIDVLFAFSAPSIFYFSGCHIGPSDRLAAVIVPLSGRTVIIAPGFEGTRMRAEKVSGDVRTWEEDEDPFALVAEVFRAMRADRGRIAVDGQLWFRVFERMKKASPRARFVSGERLIKETRWVKSEEELACIERATSHVGRGIELAVVGLRRGMSEMALSQLIGEKIRIVGSVGGGALVQSGPNASFPHNPTTERVLQSGEAVVIDSGCVVEGYCADISRTLMIGTVDEGVRHCWQIVKDAQQAAIDAVRPGVTADSIDKAARDVIDRAGYGKFFTHRTGHGLGLEGHEDPYLVRGNMERLEVGMTFTIEPGIYVPNKFGMRIEDDVAVGKDGPRMLSRIKKDWAAELR